MTEYFDELETRDPALRERQIFRALAEQLHNAKENAPACAAALAGVDPDAVADRAALARLPIIRKSELMERQKQHHADRDPFGGLSAVKTGALSRIFASPGPIYDPEAARGDYWRLGRALHAAGFRRGDIIHNSFSYHLSPAGAMLETGAHAIGCAVVPGGTPARCVIAFSPYFAFLVSICSTAFPSSPRAALTCESSGRKASPPGAADASAARRGQAFPQALPEIAPAARKS